MIIGKEQGVWCVCPRAHLQWVLDDVEGDGFAADGFRVSRLRGSGNFLIVLVGDRNFLVVRRISVYEWFFGHGVVIIILPKYAAETHAPSFVTSFRQVRAKEP